MSLGFWSIFVITLGAGIAGVIVGYAYDERNIITTSAWGVTYSLGMLTGKHLEDRRHRQSPERRHTRS